MQNTSNDRVAVIGSGSFGSVIANVLAENREVLLFTRRTEVADAILLRREHNGQKMHERIRPVMDPAEIADSCNLIFPIVPSANFREMTRLFAPFLSPAHILIHGTKGMDVILPPGMTFSRKDTDMGEQIDRKSVV